MNKASAEFVEAVMHDLVRPILKAAITDPLVVGLAGVAGAPEIVLNRRTLVCGVCGRKFRTAAGLQGHRREYHGSVKRTEGEG